MLALCLAVLWFGVSLLDCLLVILWMFVNFVSWFAGVLRCFRVCGTFNFGWFVVVFGLLFGFDLVLIWFCLFSLMLLARLICFVCCACWFLFVWFDLGLLDISCVAACWCLFVVLIVMGLLVLEFVLLCCCVIWFLVSWCFVDFVCYLICAFPVWFCCVWILIWVWMHCCGLLVIFLWHLLILFLVWFWWFVCDWWFCGLLFGFVV